MKKLLFILFLFPLYCVSQTTTFKSICDTCSYTWALPIYVDLFTPAETIDTVQCTIMYSGQDNIIRSGMAYNVRKNYQTCCEQQSFYSTAKYYIAHDHLFYLDKDKKPFPDNIIIWMSK